MKWNTDQNMTMTDEANVRAWWKGPFQDEKLKIGYNHIQNNCCLLWQGPWVLYTLRGQMAPKAKPPRVYKNSYTASNNCFPACWTIVPEGRGYMKNAQVCKSRLNTRIIRHNHKFHCIIQLGRFLSWEILTLWKHMIKGKRLSICIAASIQFS